MFDLPRESRWLEIVNDQEWGEKPIPLSGIEGYSKKAGICGMIEVVCLEPHRIRSKMDVSAPRKGFCLDINLFYIISAICLPLHHFCTCFFPHSLYLLASTWERCTWNSQIWKPGECKKRKNHCYVMSLWIKWNCMKHGQKPLLWKLYLGTYLNYQAQ